MSLKYVLIILGFWLPNLAMASDCYYDEDLVSGNQVVTDEDVLQSAWLAVEGWPSGSYDKQQYLTYENGDIVIISHRYCQMYEFEATIMWVEKPDSEDVDRIADRLAILFNEHSALKSDWEPIDPLLTKALSSMSLDSESPVSKYMPDAGRIRNNINVEADVTVASYPGRIPGVKFTTSLYVAFGGMH